MDEQKPEQLEARLAFTAQENLLHEQLLALTSELGAARQHRLSADQWQAALPHLIELSNAVARFRAQVAGAGRDRDEVQPRRRPETDDASRTTLRWASARAAVFGSRK